MQELANVLFWGGLGALAYVYVGYYLLLLLFSRLFPYRLIVDEGYTPSVTVLFSAYNERVSLPDKIESLRRLDYPRERLQVLAASDASDDGTSEYLLAQDDIETVVMESRSGKNGALNRLLPLARGEILFFTDANTVLHPESLRAIAKRFADEQVGAVTGQLIFTHEKEWSAVGRGTGLYWRYENAIKQAENRLGSMLVGCGSVLAARRELVSLLDERIANDLEIPTRIGAMGRRVLLEPDCRGFEKPHTDALEELKRTSRIVSRGARGFAALLPVMARSPLRLWQFISHKFLRWLTLPMALMALAGSGLLRESSWIANYAWWGGLTLLAASVLGAWLLLADLRGGWARPFTLLGHLLLMYLGALWGLLLALVGRTPAAWSVPQSSRG